MSTKYEPDVDVSVVIPVYNSEDCVGSLVEELKAAFAVSGTGHEIILINDCSPDRSWGRITEAAEEHPAVVGINLRRNFGQDNAIMAGLGCARGHVVIIMDDDLQHDPRDMEKLIKQIEAGYDVCYANFHAKHQAWWKNLGSWFNGKVAEIVIGKPPDVYLSPYKAIARGVVREIVKYDGPFPYVDGLIFRVTRSITQIDAEHHDRYAGQSNYNLRRSIAVWLKLATGFSVLPLRIAAYMGFSLSGTGLLLALFFGVRKLLTPGTPMGWASTIVTILVLGGVQLGCLGLVGEYLGRAFIHLNKRPQYAVRETTDEPRDAPMDEGQECCTPGRQRG
jgi:polyisoprenyl-phosphate glycosyltransferase